MCNETDFTQEKSHFYPISRIPSSSLPFAAALSLNGNEPEPSYGQPDRKISVFLTTSLKKNTTSYVKMNRDHFINFQSWEDMQSKINVEKKFKGINLEPLNVDQVAGTAPGPLLEIRCDEAHKIPHDAPVSFMAL